MTMFRSTKGASKQRRDLINTEISHMRDLLPLPESARQRLSQLQIMSMACCYIRKCNYFSRLFGNADSLSREQQFYPFSQALHGFLLITTQEGKLLYISENITEYLGHSMVDMMTQGDSLYDIIDKRDHGNVQSQLASAFNAATASQSSEQLAQVEKTFFCRMNVARSFRRQAGFGDHKMMHIRGHFIAPILPDHYGNQPVFMAVCSPLVTPDAKETALHNSTMVFQSVHGLDLKFIEISHIGEHHLGYSEREVYGKSLYELLHPEDLQEAREKHALLIKSSHEMGCMLTVRLQNKTGFWVWVNIIMHIRQPFICDSGEAAIVCISHVIQEAEAQHFKLQSQLYSSHVASSPEYLTQGSSPPHTITQVCMEPDQYTLRSAHMEGYHTGHIEEPPSYCSHVRGVVSVPDNGNPSVRSMTSEQLRLPAMSYPFSSGSDSESSGSREDGQRTKMEVISKLKRMMKTQQSEQCRPAKRQRVVGEHDDANNSGKVAYTASVIAAGIPEFSSAGMSAADGDVQVISSSYNFSPYVSLKYSKDLKESSIGSTFSMMPMTPESPLSDHRLQGVTSLALEVDTDTAVVPLSLLTPDASPVSSPANSSSDMADPLPLEAEVSSIDLSQYSPMSDKQEMSERILPFLDCPSVEDYFSTFDLESEKFPLVVRRPESLPRQMDGQPVDIVASSLSDAQRSKLSDDIVNMSDEDLKALLMDVITEPDWLKQAAEVDAGVLNTATASPHLSSPNSVNSTMTNLFELHQLNRELATSPSYGDDVMSGSPISHNL